MNRSLAEGGPRAVDLQRAFIRRTDLSLASLVGANLSFADCSNVNFRGADFTDAILKGTILKGADWTDARNLTREQISEAVLDDATRLPAYLRMAGS